MNGPIYKQDSVYRQLDQEYRFLNDGKNDFSFDYDLYKILKNNENEFVKSKTILEETKIKSFYFLQKEINKIQINIALLNNNGNVVYVPYKGFMWVNNNTIGKYLDDEIKRLEKERIRLRLAELSLKLTQRRLLWDNYEDRMNLNNEENNFEA